MGSTPLHIQLVLILQQLSHRAAGPSFFAVTHLAEFVQRGLKFIRAAAEAGGAASGQIVLFQHQHFFPGRCQIRRRRQTAGACADDNDIVLLHAFPPYCSDFSGTIISRTVKSFPLRTVFSKLPQLGQ